MKIKKHLLPNFNERKKQVSALVLHCSAFHEDKIQQILLEEKGSSHYFIDEDGSLTQMVEDDVRSFFGKKVYQTVIPRNVRISEAPSHGKPVLIYDFKCPGSQAYISLTGEVLKREKELMAC